MRWVLCIYLSALCLFAVSSCATTKTEDVGEEFDIPKNVASFKPDTSPLPDVQPWLEKAMDGNPEAQFVMSMLYRDGIMGVEYIAKGKPSPKKVDLYHEMHRWIYRQVDSGDESVFLDISLEPDLDVYDKGNDEDCAAAAESLKLLENIANHGYSNAEFVLGLIYYNGICVAQDKARGADLIQRAAIHDKKNSNAAYYTGMMYELGIERKVNKKAANAWLELAADNGNQDAKLIMALKYLDGIDVAADKEKANHYIEPSDYHAWLELLTNYFGEFGNVCARGFIFYHYVDGCIDAFYEDEGGEYMHQIEAYLHQIGEEYDDEDYFVYKQGKDSKYSVDYELTGLWLTQVARDNNNNAMILLSMIDSSNGCYFYYDYPRPTPQELLNRVLANRYPKAHRYLANYYYEMGHYDEDEDEDREKCSLDSCKDEYKQKAINELELSLKDGDFRTFKNDDEKKRYLNEVYDSLTYYCDDSDNMICVRYAMLAVDYDSRALNRAISYANGIAQKYYDAGEKSEITPGEKCNIDDKIKETVTVSKLDPDPIYKVDDNCYVNTLKWYERAYQLSKRAVHKDGERSKIGYKLGVMHRDGKGTEKNIEKAVGYFTESMKLHGHAFDTYSDFDGNVDNYYLDAANTVIAYYSDRPDRIEKLDEIYIALSIYYLELKIINQSIIENPGFKALWNSVSDYINGLEWIDGLQAAVLAEIKKEQGKSLQQFDIIQSGLNPCAAANQGKDAKCNADALYEESVKQALRGITALSIAQKGTADPRLIRNTYFHLGVEVNTDSLKVAQFKEWSPAIAEIIVKGVWYYSNGCTYLDISNPERRKLYFSWYLRQIPNAAKALYDAKPNSAKTWDDLLKEADKVIEASDDMKNAFGIQLWGVTPAWK